MWKATWKGLLAHKLRLVLTSLAIILGVSFVAGTFVLTDTLNNVFTNLFNQTQKGTDVVVRSKAPFNESENNDSQREPVPESLLSTVQNVNGVKVAAGSIFKD